MHHTKNTDNLNKSRVDFYLSMEIREVIDKYEKISKLLCTCIKNTCIKTSNLISN